MFVYNLLEELDPMHGQKGKDPMAILKQYVDSKNLRLVDLFSQLDKDGSLSVSREEFLLGLQQIQVMSCL